MAPPAAPRSHAPLARRSVRLTLVLAVVVPAALPAQSRVRVLDADSVPVPFAMVSVRGTTERATDSTGVARFSTDLGTSTRVTVRRLGYAPFDGPVAVQPDGAFVVVLQPLARDLEAVRAIAPRVTPLSRTGFYERMERVQKGAIVGWFIPPEELERRQVSQVSRVLQGVGSVRVVRDRRGRPIVTGRGGCGMTIVLDGQRLNYVGDEQLRGPTSLGGHSSSSTLGSGGLSIDEAIIGAEVMAIEIYPSLANAPDELIPLTGGGSCGLIALWTGPRR